MARKQFRILYREFLFRMVDLELLSPDGDLRTLLGQFAAALILVGVCFSATILAVDSQLPPDLLQMVTLRIEHGLISITMLVVGIFAVLSWESSFPERRDVLILAPLPVLSRTLFTAKVAAAATALSFTVVVLNTLSSLALTLALTPKVSSLAALLFSPVPYRVFLTYWTTMFAAGLFIYGSVLCLQGVAAQLLSRRNYLRLSAFLQTFFFALLLCVYFLQPSFASPKALAAPENQFALAWLPSYWFLGLLETLKGSDSPALRALALRALVSLSLCLSGTMFVYALAYFRTLRRIVEQPDIVGGTKRVGRLPSLGNSLRTAVMHFVMRTLMRSRQHRVVLAFYLGFGFACSYLFKNTPRAAQLLAQDVGTIYTSLVMTCVWVLAIRVVFGMPVALPSNWIFRMTQIREARAYLRVVRQSLYLTGVAPVWTISAVYFFSAWPWRQAAAHLVVLLLWALFLASICESGLQKIPFTCSWMPGKMMVHMALLGAVGALFLIAQAAAYEQRALEDPVRYFQAVLLLAVAIAVVQGRIWLASRQDESIVQFEDVAEPAVLGLGLSRDGVLPLKS